MVNTFGSMGLIDSQGMINEQIGTNSALPYPFSDNEGNAQN